jgi:hypothetical protein
MRFILMINDLKMTELARIAMNMSVNVIYIGCLKRYLNHFSLS